MPLTLSQSYTAVGPSRMVSFFANGGSEPYFYSVDAGGAGGTIDPTTGVYYSPAVLQPEPLKAYDTVTVTDYDNDSTSAQVLVGSPLILFCDIIRHELGLAAGRVYLWDQKLMQPTDNDLYVAVSVPSCKAFANVNRQATDGDEAQQMISMMATLDVDIISRGPTARDRKEEVLLAVGSTYSEQQQEANGFSVGRLPPSGRFINLSNVDGAAIPYRYRISLNMQYAYAKTAALPYIDDFEAVEVNTDPLPEDFS